MIWSRLKCTNGSVRFYCRSFGHVFPSFYDDGLPLDLLYPELTSFIIPGAKQARKKGLVRREEAKKVELERPQS